MTAADDARAALGGLSRRVNVTGVRGRPDDVLVNCDPGDLRAVKARLQRNGFSYQPRSGPADSHLFVRNRGRRSGPPSNRSQLTRAVQRGEITPSGWLR